MSPPLLPPTEAKPSFIPNLKRARLEATVGYLLCGAALLGVYLAPTSVFPYAVGVFFLLVGFALVTSADIRRKGAIDPSSRLSFRGIAALRIIYALGFAYRRLTDFLKRK